MISDLGSDGVLGWAHMAFKLHCFFSNIVLGRNKRGSYGFHEGIYC